MKKKFIFSYPKLNILNRINTLIIRQPDTDEILKKITILLLESGSYEKNCVYLYDNHQYALKWDNGPVLCSRCRENGTGFFPGSPSIPGDREKTLISLLDESVCPYCRAEIKNTSLLAGIFKSRQAAGLIQIFFPVDKKPAEEDYKLLQEISINLSARYSQIPATKKQDNPAAQPDHTQQYEELLQEKDLLLKELNHRVKNNLQVIYSLLNMQSRFLMDQRDSVLFEQCKNRVKSMALVHETLYRSNSPGKIHFETYLRQLVSYLFNAFGYDSHDIAFSLEIQPVLFDMETAIYCGLILNELVSNALKYAFPGDREGKILIKLSLHTQEQIQLLVEDNGVGLGSEVDINSSNTLGLKLVSDLSHQLGGCIKIQSEKGTSALVVIRNHSGIEFINED